MLSLLYILLAFLPVVFYILVIWSTTPLRSISLKKSFTYFGIGMISVGMLFTIHRVFPGITNPMGFDDMSFFILSFIQIALLEELVKWGSFNLGNRVVNKERDLPISTMIYCGISALGFAFIENITYAIMYGGEVLLIRSTLCMVLHFLCGLIMGYWISKGRIPSKLENRSLLELIFIKKPKLKIISYTILGVVCATIIHGLFDYNLFTQGHITSNYLIVFGAIIAAYLGAKNLIEYRKKR